MFVGPAISRLRGQVSISNSQQTHALRTQTPVHLLKPGSTLSIQRVRLAIAIIGRANRQNTFGRALADEQRPSLSTALLQHNRESAAFKVKGYFIQLAIAAHIQRPIL